MSAATTPIASGTDVAEIVGGKAYGRNFLNDTTGADAMGLAGATPDANTLLGRLKAIADAIVARLPTLGVKAASGSVSVAPTSDGFAVIEAGAPASSAFAITPSDSTVIATRGVYVGGAGTVVATIGGADVTFLAVPAGAILPIKATKIKLASTATGLIGLA